MDFDWRGAVKTVAPWIGTALGGPFGGMAAKALSHAVLGKDEGTEDEIAEAMRVADPATFERIKKSEQDFKLQMEAMGVKREQLASEDRKSAREMFIATKTWIVPTLAGLTVAGFFGTMTLVLMGEVDTDSTILGFVLGQISAKTEQVYNFYFGSSAGSKEKTAALSFRQ